MGTGNNGSFSVPNGSENQIWYFNQKAIRDNKRAIISRPQWHKVKKTAQAVFFREGISFLWGIAKTIYNVLGGLRIL